MKNLLIKLLTLMLVISTALFIGTACKNEDNAVSQGLEFEISSDKNGYAVVGVGDCFDVKIVIPSTYNGKPVVEIKEDNKTYVISGDECYLKECLVNKIPTGSSCNKEKSKEFIEKYSDEKYDVLLCHDN